MRALRLLIFFIAVMGMALSSGFTAEAKDKLVMGVHPYKPATELYAIFKPIVDYISMKLGTPVELQIGKTYEDTAEKLGKGEFDYCFLSPTVYAKFSSQYHYRPLVQIVNSGKPTFFGVIVVKQGSTIKSMKDFKGRSFVFGDRNSTLTHVVPLYMLMNEGIHLTDLKNHSFVGSHDNVAHGVANGVFDGAGLMPDIAEKYKEQGLVVIAKSPELPEHVFVTTKTMDDATVAKIKQALLAMDASLYKKIKGSLTGIQTFHDKDFAVLRNILAKVEPELEK